MTCRQLVLASTSPFRRELLNRLEISFKTANPQTDESALPGESPEELALRLSEAKARAVVPLFPDALIIGSDQVAILDGQVYGKPGTHENATKQLQTMRGRTVNFFTGLCLLDAKTGEAHVRGIPTLVTFRNLSDEEIEKEARAGGYVMPGEEAYSVLPAPVDPVGLPEVWPFTGVERALGAR